MVVHNLDYIRVVGIVGKGFERRGEWQFGSAIEAGVWLVERGAREGRKCIGTGWGAFSRREGWGGLVLSRI
jgi:hypothetical protein